MSTLYLTVTVFHGSTDFYRVAEALTPILTSQNFLTQNNSNVIIENIFFPLILNVSSILIMSTIL